MKRTGILSVVLLLAGALPSFALQDGGDDVDVIVGFSGQADEGVVAAHGGRNLKRLAIANAVAARLSLSQVARLRSDPRVAFIEEDGIVTIQTPAADTYPWGVTRIGAPAAWGTTRGAGAVVAVVDTGIDLDHPDLVPVVNGATYVTGTTSANDDHGHGSHVAGSVGARDNGFGVIGVAPECGLLAVKVLNKNGSGSYSQVINGINFSVNNGADVISMSLGGGYSSSLKNACDAAVAAGVVVVAAAGNGGDGNLSTNEWSYPGAFPSVICVGATESDDDLASFSNTNPEVDLAAPGRSVQSTWKDGQYATASGTSMATPHVSAVAALLVSSGLAGPDVKATLEGTAEDLGPSGRDNGFGHGLVDAEAALGGVTPPDPVHDVAIASVGAPPTATQGDVVTVSVQVQNQGNQTESDVSVMLTDTTSSTTIGTQAVASLAPGATATLNFSWNTSGASLGSHALQAEAAAVSGETDAADNTGGASVTIEEPVHDVAVTSVSAPSSAVQGDVVTVSVTVSNPGDLTESDVSVTLTDTTAGTVIGTQNVPSLAAGASTTLNFSWNTSGAAEGPHTLRGEAAAVPGETNTANNSATDTTTVTVPGSGPELRVASIEFTTRTFSNRVRVYAYVTVVDQTGATVSSASVSGTWSGAYSASQSRSTDSSGVARFYTSYVTGGGEFTFTVTNVTKSGYTFNPGASTELSDSITQTASK